MNILISDETQIEEGAKKLIEAIGSYRHIAFHAPMGGGKTTIIAALCRLLGVTDDVNSPTFSIINEYADGEGKPIYHFDFYRIESERDAMNLGLDEYFDSGALCLMEWPENVEYLLPEDTVHLEIRVEPDDARRIIDKQALGL